MSTCKADSFFWATPNRTTLFRPRARGAAAFALLVLLCLVPARTAAGAMKLLSPGIGWLTDQGRLYWTTDGGDHWTDITPIPPEVPRPDLGGVFFRDTSEGWAIISYAEQVALRTPRAMANAKTLYSIAHTTNGGASWLFMPLAYPALPQWIQDTFAGPADLYFLDSLHGWLGIAFAGNSKPGKLLATEDGGNTWKWVNSPGSSGPVAFASLRDGFLVGYFGGDRLYDTHDGANTWQQVSLSPPPQVGAATFPTFQSPPAFQDQRRGFLAVHYSGYPGTPSKLVIYFTADSGRTWNAIKVLQEAQEAIAARFAIVDSSMIVSTGSGAGRVRVVPVPLDGRSSDVTASDRGVIALTFADERNGWVLSADGGLFATHDGGSSWKHVSPASLPSLPKITVPALKGPPMKVTMEGFPS